MVSRKIAGTVLGRDAHKMAEDAGIPIFETAIEQRIAFAEAMTMGKSIFEWSASSAAVRDIQTLTHELLDVFNEQKLHPSAKAKTANG